LTVTNALSYVYREMGELDIAERYGRETLAGAEKLYPPYHPFIADTLGSLGTIARLRGDRARARALYERSIESYDRSQPNASGVALPLQYLAGLLREDGKTTEAVRLYERALAVRRKAFGDGHRDVAESWLELARGRRAARDLGGALDAARTAVRTFRSAPSTDSSQLAGGLFQLGDLLRLTGHPNEALPKLEEARAIWSRNPPKNPRERDALETSIAVTRATRR